MSSPQRRSSGPRGAGPTDSVLPPLYARWLCDLLGGPIPPETDATCRQCPMCVPPGETGVPGGLVYDPRLQCCTYFPSLPNYLVGRVLSDPRSGASRVRTMVDEREQACGLVTPLGICAPQRYWLLYYNNTDGFGRNADARCPYHQDGVGGGSPFCGIWRHRQAMCATSFCRFVRGRVGKTFWDSAFRLLDEVETVLRWWCVLQSGFGADTLARLTEFEARHTGSVAAQYRGRLDAELDAEDYRRLWGEWADREAAFYRRAARLVKALSTQDLLAMGGPRLELRSRVVRAAYQELLSGEVPPRVRVARFHVVHAGPEGCIAVSYRASDPITLPNELLRVLRYFDGRPTAAALSDIAARERITVGIGLVRRLLDHAVLEPCP